MNVTPLLALLALASTRALGFSGDVHTAISQQALAEMSFDPTAADAVVTGNLQTDKDEFWSTQAHFDNENFAAGSARLKAKLAAALDALDNCNVDAAREQLGRALHPVQDFFAHSNWVENNALDAPLDLLSLTDPAKDVVCDPATHKGPLTSGYYFDDSAHPGSPTPAPPNKCLHADLHKDDATRPFHAAARARALAETKSFLALFDNAILAKFAAAGSGEARYRVRLLKDGSAAFAEQRRSCVPGLGSAGTRHAPAPPSLQSPLWR